MVDMAGILNPAAERFLDLVAPERDDTLTALETHARERDFPTVGPDAGRVLRLLARLAGATQAFEFGSGFGYSAYWIAGGISPGGSIVLTDADPAELDRARAFLKQAGLVDRAVLEVGDARETFDRYDGPFDLVVFDQSNADYLADLGAVRGKLAPGGVVIADNAMSGRSVSFDALLALLEGEDSPDQNTSTRGIADYLVALRDDDGFETTVIPVGDGLAVSVLVG